ncbi:MAG: PAS domain S-box protein [Candidatus Eisenbacteria sp.]|nr:PAS domain S-box protein [Candidatus Eisenbacteria bacterium]
MAPELGAVAAQGSGYALACAASVAMMLMVGFLVLARSPSSAVNRSFMGIVIACCWWMGGRAGFFGSLTAAEAADWHKLSFAGLVFLAPAILLHAASATARIRRWLKAVVSMFVLSAVFCLFSFVWPDAVATIVPNPDTGWFPLYSAGGYFLVAFLGVVVLVCCIALSRSPVPSSATQKGERNRSRIILVGMAAGSTALFDLLPASGFNYPPIAHFSLLVGVALCGYAVGRHRVVILTPSTTGEAIAGTMQEALFFLDLDGTILFTNRALNSLLGYRDGDLNGRSFDVLFVRETPLQLDLGPRGRGLAGVQSAMVQTRTGASVPVTVTVNPHFDEEGEIAGFVGLGLEQVEQVRLGKRIQDLEGEIDAILGTSMFGVYTISEMRFTFVNSRLSEIIGYEAEELQGKHLEEIIHPDDHELVLGRVAMRERGENPENHYVLRAVKKNGDTVHIEIFSMVLPRDGRFIVLGLALDVTDQLRSKQGIQEVNDFNEWILRNTPAGIVTVDPQGRIDYANQRILDLLGEEAAALQGRHIRDTSLGVDPGLTAFFDENSGGTDVGRPAPENLAVPLQEGREVAVSVTRLPSAGRSDEGYLIVVDDADRREHGSGTTSIEPVRDWVSLLLGGLARDVEGQLGRILGYASLARALMPGEEKVSGYIEAITESAQKTLEMISQSEESAGGPTRHDADLSINDVVEEALVRLEGHMSSSVDLSRSMKEDLPRIEGNRAQLREMFYQLGLNALDALPDGGRLQIETEEIHLDGYEQGRQQGPRPGDYVCALFRDSGPGIPENVRERIFDPFFTTEHQKCKAGLGLWLARSVAGNHQGAVLVESRTGEGATFRVCLPVALASNREDGDPPVEGGTSEGRVLIVDDEPAVREVSSELLTEMGYEVLTAPDGEVALRIFDEDQAVDVVVLDMVMPRLDGEGTFRALQERDPSVKIVISSGYAEDEKVRDLLKKGALAFVQKPYRAQTLARAVQDAMAS